MLRVLFLGNFLLITTLGLAIYTAYKVSQSRRANNFQTVTIDEVHTKCEICLNDIYVGKEVLSCGHVFHKECVSEVFRNECLRSCPVCRRVLDF